MQRIIELTRKEEIGQELNHQFSAKTEYLTDKNLPGYSLPSVFNKLKEKNANYVFIYSFIEEIFEGRTTVETTVNEIIREALHHEII